MYAPFSSKDMATFVSPIRGAAVAMPFTNARRAFAVLERLSIVARVVSGQEERKGTNRMKGHHVTLTITSVVTKTLHPFSPDLRQLST